MARNTFKKSTNSNQKREDPVGNTGITLENLPVPAPAEPVRFRVNLELSPSVSLCLDHVCEATASTRSQVINAALLEVLPGLLDRADLFLKRGQVLSQAKNNGTAKFK